MLIDASGEIADAWTEVADGEDIPWHGPVVVPLPRLEEALSLRAATGLAIPNDTDPRALKPCLSRIGLIVIDFPSFTDGRGFSLAACLREFGYEGRLRARGPIIADQFAYLLACGFDEADVPAEIALRQPAEQWVAQLSKITLGYQRGRPIRRSIPDARMPPRSGRADPPAPERTAMPGRRAARRRVSKRGPAPSA